MDVIYGDPIILGGSSNLLTGKSWEDGYLNSSGQPAVSTTNDIYTYDYIDISDCYNMPFIAVTRSSVSSEPWIGLCFYNESQGHITRQTATNKVLLDGFYYNWLLYRPTNTNIRYVRFSTRTYAEDVEVWLKSIDKVPFLLKTYSS